MGSCCSSGGSGRPGKSYNVGGRTGSGSFGGGGDSSHVWSVSHTNDDAYSGGGWSGGGGGGDSGGGGGCDSGGGGGGCDSGGGGGCDSGGGGCSSTD